MSANFVVAWGVHWGNTFKRLTRSKHGMMYKVEAGQEPQTGIIGEVWPQYARAQLQFFVSASMFPSQPLLTGGRFCGCTVFNDVESETWSIHPSWSLFDSKRRRISSSTTNLVPTTLSIGALQRDWMIIGFSNLCCCGTAFDPLHFCGCNFCSFAKVISKNILGRSRPNHGGQAQ